MGSARAARVMTTKRSVVQFPPTPTSSTTVCKQSFKLELIECKVTCCKHFSREEKIFVRVFQFVPCFEHSYHNYAASIYYPHETSLVTRRLLVELTWPKFLNDLDVKMSARLSCFPSDAICSTAQIHGRSSFTASGFGTEKTRVRVLFSKLEIIQSQFMWR